VLGACLVVVFEYDFLDLDFPFRNVAAFMIVLSSSVGGVSTDSRSSVRGLIPSALLRRGRQMRSIWREGRRWSFAQSGRDSASA
jgi:hypothetical protein